MFAGVILADAPLEFRPADPNIPGAFEIAGRGKIPQVTLATIREHSSVVYLHFPLDIRGERDRVVRFTELLQRLSGCANSLAAPFRLRSLGAIAWRLSS